MLLFLLRRIPVSVSGDFLAMKGPVIYSILRVYSFLNALPLIPNKGEKVRETERQQENQRTQLPGDSTVFTLHMQKPRSLGESLRITRGNCFYSTQEKCADIKRKK